MIMPNKPRVGQLDEFRAHLADGEARQDAQAQKQNADGPKRFHGGWFDWRGDRKRGVARWCSAVPCARENAPQAEPVQIARGDGQIVRDGLHVGGQLFVLQHGACQTPAGLQIVHYFFKGVGGGFDVVHGGGDFRLVRRQQAVGGIGHPRQFLRKEKDVADGEADLRAHWWR